MVKMCWHCNRYRNWPAGTSSSKTVVQETTGVTCDLMGNKTADKISSINKAKSKNEIPS